MTEIGGSTMIQKWVDPDWSTKKGGSRSVITIMSGTRSVDRNRLKWRSTEMSGTCSVDQNRWWYVQERDYGWDLTILKQEKNSVESYEHRNMF